jgi:hypothetical protein
MGGGEGEVLEDGVHGRDHPVAGPAESQGGQAARPAIDPFKLSIRLPKFDFRAAAGRVAGIPVTKRGNPGISQKWIAGGRSARFNFPDGDAAKRRCLRNYKLHRINPL